VRDDFVNTQVAQKAVTDGSNLRAHTFFKMKHTRYTKVGCGALIVNDDNEVLLLKRASKLKDEPGEWARPGGRVEFCEKAEDAVIRETKEELGIDIEVLHFMDMTQVINKDRHWIALGYLARHVNGTVKNLEPQKHQDVRWFPIDKVPKNLTVYTKKAIDVYRKIM